MDTDVADRDSLISRIHQLETERAELHKDIEQLCMQQAGTGYLAIATRMHFQRTAGLEQEIESLKNKLMVCTRDNLNLREELSEAYRIKGQLADLHRVEVEKNLEAEKQVKFFQGCVAAAFAERDNSIMECEKAKETEELVSQKFNEMQNRLDTLSSDLIEQKKINDMLVNDLKRHEEQVESFKKVVEKFLEIREDSLVGFEDTSWEDRCACLLHDSRDLWSYNDASTSKYISALEEELKNARNSLDKLQSKLRMGLEIENHLKKRVRELEKKQVFPGKMILTEIAGFRTFHSQLRVEIMNILSDGGLHIKEISDMVEAKCRELDMSRKHNVGTPEEVLNLDENECRDVHISTDVVPAPESKHRWFTTENMKLWQKNDCGLHDSMTDREGYTSDALAQASREKVSALLLLSQQEERHLLERNVHAALEKKVEELQRNLRQVTNEKVKSLMELAKLKREYQQLQDGEKRPPNPAQDGGGLKSMLRKTYLKRWGGGSLDFNGNEGEARFGGLGKVSSRSSSDIDFARMMIENATFKESLESMEHLTSSIHRLRLDLLKVKEPDAYEGTARSKSEVLDDIIYEAKLLKTALGSSLPISWSAPADNASTIVNEPVDGGDPNNEKMDSISAAGFEMVELLIIAAKILKDTTKEASSDRH